MVHEELDNRGVNLDSLPCPSCMNAVESCALSLVSCDIVMRAWSKVFNWRKMGALMAFPLLILFQPMGTLTFFVGAEPPYRS